MTRRIALLALTLLLGTAACSSEASEGGVVAGDATTTAAGDTTSTAAGSDAATTTAADAPTTTADPGAPTSPAPTAAPATPAPTAAPTTVACRNVGDLYGLVDVSGVNVRRGDCGEGVKNIQDQLNYRIAAGLTVDGRFGPGTEAAVKEFQASVGLPADGIVGPNTWVALTSDDYDPSEA